MPQRPLGQGIGEGGEDGIKIQSTEQHRILPRPPTLQPVKKPTQTTTS